MAEPPATTPALEAGSEFEGLVVLRTPGRIDGAVRGRVVASALVWIGESARVEASVEAEEVVVAGELRGEVRARRRIELLSGSRVRASLEAPRMSLEEGCFVEGPCRAGQPDATRRPALP